MADPDAFPRGIDPASIDLAEVTFTPVEMECLRCHERAPMRFAGMCVGCRDELRAKYAGPGRQLATEAYEPKTNVTPNAVAFRDD
jgi:hypothetical protein